MADNRIITALRDYWGRGWQSVPVNISRNSKTGKKRPTFSVPWSQINDLESAISASNSFSYNEQPYIPSGVAIKTGPESGLFVVDIDTNEFPLTAHPGLKELKSLGIDIKATRICQTASFGLHIYYKWDCFLEEYQTHDTRIIPGTDARGLGSIVFAPPSEIYKSSYKWIWLNDIEPADCPFEIINILKPRPCLSSPEGLLMALLPHVGNKPSHDVFLRIALGTYRKFEGDFEKTFTVLSNIWTEYSNRSIYFAQLKNSDNYSGRKITWGSVIHMAKEYGINYFTDQKNSDEKEKAEPFPDYSEPVILGEMTESDYVFKQISGSGAIAQRGTLMPIGAMQQSGKTVLALHSIVRPALEHDYVLDRFKVNDDLKILYIQSDYGKEQFYNKFFRPFGFKSPPVDRLRFVHIKDLEQRITTEITPAWLTAYLEQHGAGFDLVFIDTLTTMFPKLVWAKSAQEDAVALVKHLSRIAIKNNCCIIPMIHTRKRMQVFGSMPPEIDSDEVMGPHLRVCEAVLGVWPCYWVIKIPTDKFTKKGDRVYVDRYYPAYGHGCIKSLKNIEVFDGFGNIARFEIDNSSSPRKIVWHPYENHIMPGTLDQITCIDKSEKIKVFFMSEPENPTVSDVARATGLSVTTVANTIKADFFAINNLSYRYCDGKITRLFSNPDKPPLDELFEEVHNA